MTFGLDSVNVFVGAGPYFNSDGTLHANENDAVGLLLKNVTLAVGLFKHTAGPGSGSYYAISAFAETFDPVGLGLGGSDTFSLRPAAIGSRSTAEAPAPSISRRVSATITTSSKS